MRTLQHQLQDLADWISGLELDPAPAADDFADGALRAAWRAISGLPWNDQPTLYRDLCATEMRKAMTGYPGGSALCERILRVIPRTIDRPFRNLEEIGAGLRPVSWLWPGWLPLGMLTLLAARPGTGKSLIALDLAGRIITGQPWPDGAAMTQAPGRNVIYIDGENIPEVHNERALAWDLPRANLYPLLPDEEDMLIDLSGQKYQELLSQMVYRLEPALVVVDSLGAVMGKGENAVEEVRGLLGYLAGLAQHHAASVLIIHHLRKSTGGQLPLFETIDPDQIRGSGHITAMSRVAWGLTTVQTGSRPDPNGPRKLQVIKSNLARHPDPIGVTLDPLPDGDHVRVVYDQAAPEPYQEPTQRDEAAEWLLDYLEQAGQPVSPKAVVAAARDAGFSRTLIYRTRESLAAEIVNTGGRRSPDNAWALAAEAV